MHPNTIVTIGAGIGVAWLGVCAGVVAHLWREAHRAEVARQVDSAAQRIADELASGCSPSPPPSPSSPPTGSSKR